MCTKSTTYSTSGKGTSADLAVMPVPMMTASHFAFMRALLQGIDPQTCWARYMSRDGRSATAADIQGAIDSIRNAYNVVIEQHKRPKSIRLTPMCFAAAGGETRQVTTLADFVTGNGLDGFSEAEQFVFYETYFGRSSHNLNRLVARQIAALNWLQRAASQPVGRQEKIADWLEPSLANRLAAAGLVFTVDLHNVMERRGSRWFAGLDCIGVVKAARIAAAWTARRGQSTDQCPELHDAAGYRPDSEQAVPDGVDPVGGKRAIPDVLIAPLHHQSTLLLIARMGGAARVPRLECRIAAVNDFEAVRGWLQAVAGPLASGTKMSLDASLRPNQSDAHAATAGTMPSGQPAPSMLASVPMPGWGFLAHLSNTQRAYWKEAERFLLWLAIERNTTLSALRQPDCRAYAAFLRAPGGRWCGPRGRSKESQLWRPFEGPLSPRGQAYATGVLRRLYRFLVDQGYLVSTPWEDIADPTAAAETKKLHRPSTGFDRTAWRVIDQVRQQLVPTSANNRLQVAIALLQSSGASLGTLVRASVEDLEAPRKPRQAWRLRLPSVNRSLQPVLLQPDTVQLLQGYFVSRGLDAALQAPANRGVRLLGRATDASERAPWAPCARQPIDARSGIGLGTMADQLRAFFQLCAQACVGNTALATRFTQANSHWLRGKHG